MSEAVSALAGATCHGFCTVTEAGLTGMVALRVDLGQRGLATALKAATGCALPGQGAITAKAGRKVAWMSPDELMIFCGYDEAPGIAAALAAKLAKAHALVTNVSDARAVIRVDGPACREVIAKLSPADVAVAAFGPGQMRRTRLQQVPAAFHMPDETSFEVVVFRSVARYGFDLLANAARPGSEVGLFPAGA